MVIDSLTTNEVFVITDNGCKDVCTNQISTLSKLASNHFYVFDEGEQNKTSKSYLNGIDFLAQNSASRNSQILNIGGGVTTDLGGFIASTYKRGIEFIHIPTSLMAMVDAAHGGKVAINHNHLKNYIGCFAEASHILICPNFLTTLSPTDLLSGYAEVLKHGLIASSSHWESQKTQRPESITMEHWHTIIQSSIEIKQSIVQSDPFDKSVRKILNFGHTVGHAIESFLLRNGRPTSHGEAVAAGMIVEANIAHFSLGLSKLDLDDIDSHLVDLFGKLPLKHSDIAQLISLIHYDKKNEKDTINMALIPSIGTCNHSVEIKSSLIEKCLTTYIDR